MLQLQTEKNRRRLHIFKFQQINKWPLSVLLFNGSTCQYWLVAAYWSFFIYFYSTELIVLSTVHPFFCFTWKVIPTNSCNEGTVSLFWYIWSNVHRIKGDSLITRYLSFFTFKCQLELVSVSTDRFCMLGHVKIYSTRHITIAWFGASLYF